MNISQAIFYNKLSPDTICKDFYSIVKGFEEVNEQNNRKINFYDLFILFAFYNYKPAIEEFTNVKYDKYTTFKLRVERNPDIFANIQNRFKDGISFCKTAILYGLNNNIFIMDKNLNISTIKTRGMKIQLPLKNIGKTFATKSTEELYNYFKVNINEI
ncbi:three component ABC system middle component [Poseidonibacter ostreae]|uniref:Uncharacterized protein n=1 Tax=Poseidonibacter ostreae TaxID=2654171 RepID=A0A6L4WTX2_9BACT|nr:three component ABC system middle component [Poseidonibacter ostreae]KAB7889544.1 hypothetical protein GBG19_05675 [Poseidonibacter ostreae]